MHRNTSLADRMKILIDESKLTIPKFALEIGSKTPQAIREILKGNTKTLSGNLTEGLFRLFPELNPLWLHDGEGEMYIDRSALITKDEALLLAANDNIVSVLSKIDDLQKELKETSEERRDLIALAKSQQQTIAQLTESNNRLTQLLDGYKKVSSPAEAVGALSSAVLP